MKRRMCEQAILAGIMALALTGAVACTSQGAGSSNTTAGQSPVETMAVADKTEPAASAAPAAGNTAAAAAEQPATTPESTPSPTAAELYAALNVTEIYYDDFIHGDKPAAYQKWIVLHDTEGEGDGESVVSYWESSGNHVAAHFVVNKDGSVVQCVPLDCIAHHAGFGNTGHNQEFGVEDESRDDMVGTVPIGDWAADYGMNSYSVGIEMVHVGASGADYPQAQLEALDLLIAYIDAYYGFECPITDHKAWRTGNSDTSAAFAGYLENYQTSRNHAGV
ncbi:MAG: peptidoglycan recognition family protein [Coriobacteriia bacterium]|nr:peptidoglycan recognition family protein [Coriobacteriia bacterium]